MQAAEKSRKTQEPHASSLPVCFTRCMMLDKQAKPLLCILVREEELPRMILDTLLHPIPKSVKHVMTARTQRNTSPVQEQQGPQGKFADLLSPLHFQIQL